MNGLFASTVPTVQIQSTEPDFTSTPESENAHNKKTRLSNGPHLSYMRLVSSRFQSPVHILVAHRKCLYINVTIYSFYPYRTRHITPPLQLISPKRTENKTLHESTCSNHQIGVRLPKVQILIRRSYKISSGVIPHDSTLALTG